MDFSDSPESANGAMSTLAVYLYVEAAIIKKEIKVIPFVLMLPNDLWKNVQRLCLTRHFQIRIDPDNTTTTPPKDFKLGANWDSVYNSTVYKLQVDNSVYVGLLRNKKALNDRLLPIAIHHFLK